MAYMRSTDPDIMEIRRGGGWMILLGLPFFVGGLLVMGASLGPWTQKGDPPPLSGNIPFGGLFAAVGAGRFRPGRGKDQRARAQGRHLVGLDEALQNHEV